MAAELDLLVVRGKRRLGFEFKLTEAPTVTPSMHVAYADLDLESLTVVHGGKESWRMKDGIDAVAATALRQTLRPLS